jgi:hypothetical protein
MSRRTPGDDRIIRLLVDKPGPPHDDTGDLEGATGGPFWCGFAAQLAEQD